MFRGEGGGGNSALLLSLKNGRQNRPSGAKTGLLRWLGAKSYFPGDTRNVGDRRGLSYHGPAIKRITFFLRLP